MYAVEMRFEDMNWVYISGYGPAASVMNMAVNLLSLCVIKHNAMKM